MDPEIVRQHSPAHNICPKCGGLYRDDLWTYYCSPPLCYCYDTYHYYRGPIEVYCSRTDPRKMSAATTSLPPAEPIDWLTWGAHRSVKEC